MKDKLKKHFSAAICLLLSLAIVLAAIFFPEKKQEEATATRIVRVWNVDTFEGGKGSRTAYLKSAARRVEKKREGVYFLVSAYTPEGAEEAFREEKAPDVLSFGVGLSLYAEASLPLSESFTGGQLGSETLAYPWCRGGYALFSLTENFDEAGKTAISSGGRNLPQIAAALEGIEGDELPALTAYTKFLSGEYKYLLGTQRDLCRFQARGVNVYSRPITSYCDLYQYFSVLSPDLKEDCLALLDELKSSSEKLSDIGMFPFEETNGFVGNVQRTVGVFTSADALKEMNELARERDEKKLENFLKTI